MRLQEIIHKFDNVKKQGAGFICKCPVCGDMKHLYLHEKSDKVLMYCQKCNAGFKDIAKLVDLPKQEMNANNKNDV